MQLRSQFYDNCASGCRERARCDDKSPIRIRRDRNHVRGCGSHPFGAFASESVIEADVAAFAPPELLETLSECCEIGLPDRIRLSESHDHADAAHTFALLCARRKGPSCGAA